MKTRFVLLLFVSCLLASANIIRIGSGVSGWSGAGASSIATSSTMNVAAGNLVVCQVSLNNNQTVTSVSDGGSNSMTGLHLTAPGNNVSQIWYKANTTANATATWTANVSASLNTLGISCLQYSGVLTSSPVDVDDTSGTGSGNSGSTTTAAITTAVAGELIITAQGLDRASAAAVTTSGYSLVISDSGSATNIAEKIVIGTVSSESTSWTFTNSPWHAPSIASFKPAAAVTTFAGQTVNGVPNQSLVQGLVGGAVSLTAQTGAVSTATLCAAVSCPAGQYRIEAYLTSTVTCATPGPAVVGVTLTWTDGTGTKSAQVLPLDDNSGTTLSSNLALGTTTGYAVGAMDLC